MFKHPDCRHIVSYIHTVNRSSYVRLMHKCILFIYIVFKNVKNCTKKLYVICKSFPNITSEFTELSYNKGTILTE